MKTELIDVSPTRKEIKITIEPAVVREAYDRISDEYAKKAKVPGFRPGHAPRSVVRTRFKSEIRADALQELVPDAVNAAISEHTPSAIGQPNVQLDTNEALEKFGEEPLSVRVNVEVLPEVELKDYKGLEVSRQTRPITDADVEEMINALRETSATLLPVEDRASQPGDTVTVSVDGKFLDHPEEENIKSDEVEVTLGAKGVQQEFTDNLTGVKVDDEKTFIVEYPEDFSSKGLAGKRVEYATKVTAVRVKELPPADDEWARSLGDEFDSVETLRTKMLEDLETRASQEADHRVRSQLMEKLLAGHQFEVPESLVEHQTSFRLESVVRNMIGRGLDPRSQEINWEGAREELKGQAQADVRSQMLLEQIADQEKIDVSKEEIDAEIEEIAVSSKQPVEQVRTVLTKEGGERSIANRLRNRKALDFLVANAAITDEEWQDDGKDEDGRLKDE
ncbi:MAG TPA: trigger factor [Pyrinomonadaceae bacterium]|nr:trigger factor [Pyrinomonadaceae bacterium]